MSGAEALEAYNTAERNLDGKLILENGLGVPVNIVGSEDNVTSVELLVEGTIYREMEGNVDSENWGELLSLYEGHHPKLRTNLGNEHAPMSTYTDFLLCKFLGSRIFWVVINCVLIQVLRGVYDKEDTLKWWKNQVYCFLIWCGYLYLHFSTYCNKKQRVL